MSVPAHGDDPSDQGDVGDPGPGDPGPGDPGPGDVIVDAADLEQLVASTLERAGATHDDAAVQARMLVEGDLRDRHSHGVRRLPILVERLRNGLIVSGRPPTVTWTADALAQVDGHRGFGPVVGFAAVDAVCARAERTGIALAAVAGANHLGMLAPYLERITERGYLGLVLTTSEALVHPWNGAKAMVGTNPIGIGVPTQADPLILDMSTASVSMGKILDFAQRSRAIPLGWAVDEHGAPTTDAALAADGAISPFGGPKGYALGIALEALVAVLSGTALGTDVRGTLDSDAVSSKGDVFVAISLDAVGGPAAFVPLTAYLSRLRQSGPDPEQPVTVPGDRMRTLRRHRLQAGIPLHQNVWNQITALAEARLGPDPSGAPETGVRT